MVLFSIICTDAAWLSQYTLRYRYVTGSWLRPDTRKVNGLTRPDGLAAPGIRSQTSSDRLRELYVSEVFTVIPEACEAAAVKLVGVVVSDSQISACSSASSSLSFSSSVNVWLLIKRRTKNAKAFHDKCENG